MGLGQPADQRVIAGRGGRDGWVVMSSTPPGAIVEPAVAHQSLRGRHRADPPASAGYAYLLTHVLFLNYVWGYTLLEAGMAVAPAALVAAVVAAVLGPRRRPARLPASSSASAR